MARLLAADFTAVRRAALRALLERGRDAGELFQDADLDMLVDMASGVLYYRLLVGHAPLDENACALAGGRADQIPAAQHRVGEAPREKTTVRDKRSAMSTKPAGPVSVPDVIAQLPHPWQQRDLAFANDTVLRVVRFEGAFRWHQRDQDELYLCWDGSFRVEFEGGDSVVLRAGTFSSYPRASGTGRWPMSPRTA